MSYQNHGTNIARLVYEEPNNLVDYYTKTVAKYPDRPAIGTKDTDGVFQYITYGEFGKRIDAIRGGIANFGFIRPGDKIGIIAGNRLEWALGAFATFGLKACWVPMYEKELESMWAYVIKDSGIKILFVSTPEIYDIVSKMKASIPTLQKIILIEGSGENSLAHLEEIGKSHPVDPKIPAVDDDASIIYTSGTTGEPKGVILTHGNMTSNSNAGSKVYPNIQTTSRALSILPWAHSYAQTAEIFTFVKMGASIAITDLEHLSADLAKANPTHLICVPRLFNKIYQGIHQVMEETGGMKYKLFLAAKGAAKRKRETGKSGIKLKVLDKLVFSKVRAKFGTQLQESLTASAKTETEVANFFFDIGLPIYDCYGMTELSPAATMNCERFHRLGSVGKPIEHVRVVIDKSMMPEGSVDGEIQVFGPNVMKGFLNKPEQTAAIIITDKDGMRGVRTGDLGHLDEDNYLFITGRIKEEYKLLNGKYVHPSEIEQYAKLLPWIANIMIYGDGRTHNVALIVPNPDYLAGYAKKHGLNKTYKELVNDGAIQAKITEILVAHLKTKFGGYEIPKNFAFLTEDFTLENRMLTQTMKLKRRSVLERYGDLIETLYKV